eukprot:scaffold74471_cov63-Phaeocystis_antarctica.AAC.1
MLLYTEYPAAPGSERLEIICGVRARSGSRSGVSYGRQHNEVTRRSATDTCRDTRAVPSGVTVTTHKAKFTHNGGGGGDRSRARASSCAGTKLGAEASHSGLSRPRRTGQTRPCLCPSNCCP